MRTKTILALVGLLALGFAVQGGNLVPEGKRDFLHACLLPEGDGGCRRERRGEVG